MCFTLPELQLNALYELTKIAKKGNEVRANFKQSKFAFALCRLPATKVFTSEKLFPKNKNVFNINVGIKYSRGPKLELICVRLAVKGIILHTSVTNDNFILNTWKIKSAALGCILNEIQTNTFYVFFMRKVYLDIDCFL